MIPKFLQPEVWPYASVEVIPATQHVTHYVPAFAGQLGVRSRAVCGAYVDPAREHHPDPTCQNCMALLEIDAAETRALDEKWMGEDRRKAARIAPPAGLSVAVTPMRKECSWCGALIQEGARPVSHGICPACAERVLEAGA